MIAGGSSNDTATRRDEAGVRIGEVDVKRALLIGCQTGGLSGVDGDVALMDQALTRLGLSVVRRFLVIVATPELFGSCDGSRSPGSGTTDDEA
jgi:hypothetical protein